MKHTPTEMPAAPRAVRARKRASPLRASRAAAAAGIEDRPRLPPRHRQNPWLGRILVFATCVLLADALFGERSLAEGMRARHDYEIAAAGLNGLRQENAHLREQVRGLREDARVIEAVARRELGLIKPGELLVTVRDHRSARTPAPTSLER